MKRLRWQILMGLFLIALSAGLYVLQVRVFHAERDTLFYLFQDLAFVPIQVLIVTVIIDQVLRIREKLAMLNKLNMVIGTFFSEVGTRLLKGLSGFDLQFDDIRADLLVTAQWSDQRFSLAARDTRDRVYRIDCKKSDLSDLRRLLSRKKDFLLNLLANPNLLEHETFTELLWAVFHLTEELAAREGLEQLPDPDCEHIAGDIGRAYRLLIIEWLAYMKHLKNEYPYLFSLAVRTNPFDPDASAIVQLKR